ncbi:MAG: tRNA (adenosine(37)-N6)-dimethylallyltransferase MiaA [bacterium]|nr:tRNA (adenosine(37)-N6)-dimethylallyltransferase MiaA [bacterium]
MHTKLLLPVIVGPTGVGKTEIAIEVAIRLNAEIISCDSRQVYKYMDIGTAKPTKAQQIRVPHHMIDVVTPDVDYNAWDYAKEARSVINEVVKREKVPLVVGGSGLYLRALIDGFFQVPKPPQIIRERLRRESPSELYRRLIEVDKVTADKLHPNDTQRIMRAIEVYETTKIPMSELKATRVPFNCDPIYVGLTMPMTLLYNRIENRVDLMIENGFINEVKSLLDKGYSPELNSLQTIGYKEVVAYLQDKITLDEAVRLIKQNTCRYAKRQLTWFRALLDIKWIELSDKVMSNIKTQIANIFIHAHSFNKSLDILL